MLEICMASRVEAGVLDVNVLGAAGMLGRMARCGLSTGGPLPHRKKGCGQCIGYVMSCWCANR